MKKATKKYTRDFGLSMAAYVAAIVAIHLIPSIDTMPLWQAAALTLIPMIPIIFAVKAEITYCRSWDELRKQQALEGVLIAFLLVGVGTFSYGFLEGVGFPPLESIWVFPLMIFAQAFGRFIAMRKYQ